MIKITPPPLIICPSQTRQGGRCMQRIKTSELFRCWQLLREVRSLRKMLKNAKTKMCETLNPCEEQCVGTVEELQKQAPYCMKMGAYRSAPRRPKKCRQRERGPSSLTISDMCTGHSYSWHSYSLAGAHSMYLQTFFSHEKWTCAALILCYLSINICEVGVLGCRKWKMTSHSSLP